jgi:long-subunit fatty acid transport protein
VVGDIHSLGLAYKADINERLSYAVIYDQPFGAGINYAAPGYPISGDARLSSHALSGLLKYNLGNGTSVYGGLRVHSIEGSYSVVMPFGPYSATTTRDIATGYVLGAAYEKPEYGVRFALTYQSGITHKANATESSSVLGVNTSQGSISLPQSVNFDFQSGIAKDTLVFGSVRWAEWSSFGLELNDFATLTGGGSLVGFDNDTWTTTLGVARRLTDNWSVAGAISYERAFGDLVGNFTPTDGHVGYSLAATYMDEKMKVTTHLNYASIGDATTEVIGAEFSGNSAWGFGISVGWSL